MEGHPSARAVSPLARLRAALPQGLELPRATWESRHRVILAVLAAHAVVLPVFGWMRGWAMPYVVGEGLLLAGMAGLAALPRLGRRFRASVAAFGCVTSSAVLTQFSGGFIEAHFHFFIVIALVAMYQDWAPFLVAVLYVALDHGIVGTLAPEWVYNHPDAIAHPWKWAMIHAVAVLAECGALLAFWASAEEARIRSDLFLSSAGDGILGLDLEGRVTFANPAAAALLGGTPDTLVGQSASRWMSAWTPARAGVPGEGTLAAAGPAGQAVPVEWLLAPTVRSGVTVGYVLTVKDVTRRRQEEDDRRRMEMLEAQDKFKTQLLNTASHELNTPIGLLRLQLALLHAEEPTATPRMREALARLRRNVDRLASLVKDTLDVARLESGHMPLDLADTDLRQLAAETCESFAETARQKGVALLPPEAGPPVVARVDAGRIGQVLANLVGNAVKFTPPGGSVRVLAERRPGAARVEILDSGPGVDAAERDKLFRPFSQLAKTSGSGGTGLGLYISKGIVSEHGGRIWCDAPGQGAVFGFEVPDAPADGQPDVQAATPVAVQATP